MASDGNPVKTPVASLVHGSQAPIPVSVPVRNGNTLPAGGKSAASAAAPAAVRPHDTPSTQALIAQLNKHLNDSGRPDQFRIAPNSGDKLIQQVNPASGEVIGEFLASEFPALARGAGLSGTLVDSRA
jgi:hypothetical protein